MKASLKLKALVGGALLFAAGSAFANTALDAGAGSIFVNLWDQTNGTSFIYDTGLNQSTFNGSTSSVNVNLASDPNWTAFVAGITGGLTGTSDTITYNVVAVGLNTVFTTGGATPSGVFNSKLNQADGNGATLVSEANSISSTTTNSAYATPTNGSPSAGGGVWGVADPQWGSNLKTVANTSLGTALNFYSITFGTGSHTASNIRATIVTFANTWLLDSAGNLTYNNTVAPIPVPAPLGLLLAGLALMGVIARRRKTGDTDFGGAAA